MTQVETTKIQGGADYALVPARLKAFRENNPRAKTETTPTYNDDGSITFRAVIIADQSDEFSATATGNARYTAEELKKTKAFEKLETIALGRALAQLGYLNNGQIATSEEMLEFEEFRMEKYRAEIEQAQTIKELMDIFNRMNTEEKKIYAGQLSAKKKELTNANS